MTLLPTVRRQLSEAAERQVSRPPKRWQRLSVGGAGFGRRPSIGLTQLALVASVLVVAAVGAAFLSSRGSTPAASRGSNGVVTIIFTPQGTPQSPAVSQAALARTVAIMRQRLRSSFRDVSVTRSAGLSVTVVVRHAGAGARARILAASSPARLYFYDWEANALTPPGRSVATGLATQNRSSILISQGSAGAAPGSPDAGGMSLYSAVKLASEQKKPPVGPFNSRLGPLYYEFGASGSDACASAGKFYGFIPLAGQRCLLSGPATTISALRTGLPPGINPAGEQVLSVPRGIVVLQAVPVSLAQPPKLTDPSSRFFVLTDRVALQSAEITNPRAITDASGSPAVSFGFTPRGNREFEAVTARIARRGAADSSLGQQLDQHFGVVLDNQLMTVPSIDFRQYPAGIIGAGSADITGGFTKQSARQLASELRLGALPVQLTATS